MSLSKLSLCFVVALSLSLFLGLAACSDDEGGLEPLVPAGGANIAAIEYVSEVNQDGATAPYTDEAMPAGTIEAPLLLGARQYVVGGSIVVQVGTPTDATEILVSVAGSSSGYWTIDLATAAKAAVIPVDDYVGQAEAVLEKLAVAQSPASALQLAENSYLINVTPSGEAGRTAFRLTVAVRTPEGLSRTASHSVVQNTTAHGSDWLQVSLNWIHPVDMDLHVQTPEGEDIYWAHRTGTNGGFLDLDSNAACSIDGIQNENIRWLRNAPSAGDYIIRLDLWSACTQTETFPYVISVILNGEMTLYQGEMSASEADGGGEFAGRTITTLNVPVSAN